MRVMHVITNMMASGGAEVMLLRLVRVAGSQRPVIVSLMDVSERYRHLITDHDLDVRALKAGSVAGMTKAVWTLASIMREERPDAVMCWLYHAMIVAQLAAWRAGIDMPVFWNVRQSLDDIGTLSGSTRVALGLSRLLSRWPSGIVFNSARALDLHRQFGYRNSNCIVIPNGFDLIASVPARALTPTVFGIAGRLHAQKDYGTFFAAAAKVRRIHSGVRFIAAGAGLTPNNEVVRQMIAAAGLPFEAIELRGNTSDMDRFYGDIDGLVLSSRTEGFPNVVAEAMSFGKPVISTDVGDAAIIVGDTGFIVPPGDPSALADAIRRMLYLGSSEYAALSGAAKARIDRFYSLPHVANLYDTFLRGARKPVLS
jgi:glycosyltransferase involved in cell wall biosynthesis